MIVSELTLAYENTPILENISFEFREHLLVLGANGSGKSTLAKALCGLLPYAGSIKLSDHELSSIPPRQRAKGIAYIPAKMHSFESFTTVEEFVLLGRYPYKDSFKDYTQEDKQIAKEALEEMGLASLCSHRLHELSSGQQQLTLIAQALAQKSTILIFDEPTSNLDPKNTALFVQELKKLRQRHKTILISHDIQLAAHLNDPVLFLNKQKATYHEKGFFDKEQLSLAYGVSFVNDKGVIGVSYE